MDFYRFLDQNNMGHLHELFDREEIDFETFLELTNKELKELGLPLGSRKKLIKIIDRQNAVLDQEDSAYENSEKRCLSTLMCDIEGSTYLSIVLDLEHYQKVINSFRYACEAPIRKYQGQLDQLEGDGLLAYFGYPQAHENDAERALRAANEIQDYIENTKFDHGIRYKVRFGIATGLTVVKPKTGESATKKGGVYGEFPNFSKKLQTLACPGQAVICGRTKYAIEKTCKKGGGYSFRQIENDLVGWRNHEIWVVEDQFESEIESVFSQTKNFVGRETTLKDLREKWRNAVLSEGQFSFICGDPGVGKTTLIQYFEQTIQLERHLFLQLQCSQFHQNTPYNPIVEYFRADIKEKYPTHSEPSYKNIGTYLNEIGTTNPQFCLDLCRFMGVKCDVKIGDSIDKWEKRRENFISELLKVLGVLSAQTPVILCLEDAQWADSSTTEFFRNLYDKKNEFRMLVLVTTREETNSIARLHSVDELIKLNSLGLSTAKALVDRLDKNNSLDKAQADEVIEKSSGNPLFIVEIVKLVLDDFQGKGGDKQDSYLPLFLQSVFLEKLDRITRRRPIIKKTAHICAVYGAKFSLPLIKNIIGQDVHSIAPVFQEFIEHGLLKMDEGGYYQFSHSLMRDVIYESILMSEQRDFHKDVAKCLISNESQFGQVDSSFIASHLFKAGEYSSSAEWWCKSAKHLFEIGAPVEAVEQYKKSFEICSQYGSEFESSDEVILRTYLGMGESFRSTQGTASTDAEKCFMAAKNLAIRINEPVAICRSLYGQFATSYSNAKYDIAEKVALELLSFGKQSSSSEACAISLQALGITCFARGEFSDAKKYLEDSISLMSDVNKLGDLTYSQYPFTAISYLSWALFVKGEVSAASDQVASGIRLLPRANTYQRALFVCNICYLLQWSHDVRKMREVTYYLKEFCQQSQLKVWEEVADFFIAWCGSGVKNTEKEFGEMEKFLNCAEPFEKQYFLTLYAERLLDSHRLSSAKIAITEAIKIAQTTGELWYMAETYRVKAVITFEREGKSASFLADLGRAKKIAANQEAYRWVEKLKELEERCSAEPSTSLEYEPPKNTRISFPFSGRQITKISELNLPTTIY